jgi:hypothetical protein
MRNPVYSDIGRGAAPTYTLESGQHMMNKTAAELLSPAISNSHDALHLLSEAAGRTENLNRQSLVNRQAARQSSTSTFAAAYSLASQANAGGSPGRAKQRIQKPGTTGPYYQGQTSGPVDPRITSSDAHMDHSGDHEDPDYVNARRAWSRLRFVRAGWFTVDEAMGYIA